MRIARSLFFALGLTAALLVCTSARATPLSELAESMEPGTWAELETNDLLPAISQTLGIGATGSIFPYAEEGVWHAPSGRFFFIGSDHIYDAPTGRARVIAYIEDDNRWEVLPDPPWLGNGTEHGYDHTAVLGNLLYHINVTREQALRQYDPATGEWSDRASHDEGGYNHFGGLEPFDELDGLVYVEGGGVYFWDRASDSWSTIDTGVPMGDYHNFAEYNPVHGVVLLGGGNDSGVVHVLRPDRTVTPASAAPFPLRVNEAIVTVDPISGDYVVLGGPGEMWVYDVTMDEWSLQPDTVPPSLLTRGIADLTIAGPVDSYGVILFVKHIGVGDSGEAEVWLYKHSPGMGVGRPDGGVMPGRDGGGSVGDEDGGGVIPARDGGGPMTGDGGGTMTGGDDDGGCGCRVANGAPASRWPLALVAVLGVALGRRRRSC